MSQVQENQILNQTTCPEFSKPVNIRVEYWTNKGVILEVLDLLNRNAWVSIDATKIIAVEKIIDSCCDSNPDSNSDCEKSFIIYLPFVRVAVRYKKHGNNEFVDANIVTGEM